MMKVRIQNHAKVYLTRKPGQGWRIDSNTFDGASLDGDWAGDYLSDDGDPAEAPQKVQDDLNKACLPTGDELMVLMVAAQLGSLRKEYRRWWKDRMKLSEAEFHGPVPADDWHDSDDTGTELLVAIADALGWDKRPAELSASNERVEV